MTIKIVVSRSAAARCALLLTVAGILTGCFEDQSGNPSEAIAAAATIDTASVANQAPEIVGVPTASIESGQTYTFEPSAKDADSDFLEFEVTNKPTWARFNNETGTLSGTPQDTDVGETQDITIAVTDGRDLRAIGPFRIRVGQRGSATTNNTAPVISGAAGTSVQVGSKYSFTPAATDVNGDRLSFVVSNRPSWATFNTTTGALAGTPTAANVGTYANIVVSVTDGRATTSLPPFSIQVNNSDNRLPTISGTPSTSVLASQAYSFAPVAADADGDTLAYTIQNKPSWATFSATNGRLSGTPAVSNVGTFANVVISVSDGKASTSLTPFTINVVAPTNRAPTIAGTPGKAATVGSAYRFQPSASDPDGDALGYTIQNRPTWATFDTATGVLMGTPSAVGTFGNIVISASDGKATVSLAAFGIVVTQPANGAPTISGSPATSVSVGNSYSFQPSASDPNGEALTWSIANKPSWTSFSTVTGKLSGTPAAGNTGNFSNIVITVTDGKSSTSLSAFSITVTQNATGNASLSWQAPTQNVDGTPLGNLAGFRIMYGTNASALTQMVELADAYTTQYTLGGLTSGTWYFAVKAYTSAGAESALSDVVNKTVP